MSYWKEKADAVIDRVIHEVGTGDEAALRKAISAAYPFGERARLRRIYHKRVEIPQVGLFKC